MCQKRGGYYKKKEISKFPETPTLILDNKDNSKINCYLDLKIKNDILISKKILIFYIKNERKAYYLMEMK